MTQDQIAAILLAAGESTRMGRLKQLLPWGDSTLIGWQVLQLQDAGAVDVVVVLGYQQERIRPAVPQSARAVVNDDYAQGRASSLRCGAEALDASIEAILILSVDQPRPAWIGRRLIERWRETGSAIVSPRFSRRFGHPVLLSGRLLAELRTANEESLGLRAVIDRHLSEAESFEVENERIDVDLNTPEEYEAALAAFTRGDWGEDET